MQRINTDTNIPNELKSLKAFCNWCIDRRCKDTNPVVRRKVRFNVCDRVLADEVSAAFVHTRIYTGQRRAQIATFDTA